MTEAVLELRRCEPLLEHSHDALAKQARSKSILILDGDRDLVFLGIIALWQLFLG